MMGLERVFLPSAMATMAETMTKANGLTEFVRCSMSGQPDDYQVRSTGAQSSGVLRSLSLGDGLIIGPADTAVLEQGRRVRVVILHGATVGDVPPF
jgi:molybdopterin biosynthesis enzyme